MKKVLVGYIIDGKHSGIDKYLLNFAKAAYDEGVKLDFLTNAIDPDLKQQMDSYGFGLLSIPSLKHPLKQYKAIKRILQEGHYDGVYFNISEAFHCAGVYAAYRYGVPVRIVHSHSSGSGHDNRYVRSLRHYLHRLFRQRLYKMATHHLTCSQVAGEWMFPCKSTVIYNAVDFARFAFRADVRQDARQSLGLTDELTLIHVGNFCYPKNHAFLMDVMKQVCLRDDRAVLLCAGDGGLFQEIKAYAASLGLENNVRFLGIRTDVPQLLCAADVFVFPSRFEGLSITCVEAQAAGLPCILSHSITPETKISDRVEFLPFDAPQWADAIFRAYGPRSGADVHEAERLKYDFASQRNQLIDILRSK